MRLHRASFSEAYERMRNVIKYREKSLISIEFCVVNTCSSFFIALNCCDSFIFNSFSLKQRIFHVQYDETNMLQLFILIEKEF